MPIDSSIALGVRPVQIESPVNALARVLQLKQAQQEGEMGAMRMDEYRRGVDEQNALMRAIRAPGFSLDDPTHRAAAFQASPIKTQALLKAQTDMRKDATTADKTAGEVTNQRIAMYRDNVNSVTDPQTAAQYVSALYNDPALKDSAITKVPLEKLLASIPQDPAQLGAWKQQFALGATKFMEMNKPTFTTRNLGGTTDTIGVEGLTGKVMNVNSVRNTQSPDSVASSASAAASRAQAERHFQQTQAQPRGQFLETPDGYVLADPRGGAVKPVLGADGQPLKGKAANRQLTDAQAKANLFGSRMEESHRILNELEGKYSPMAVNSKMSAGELPLIGGVAGAIGNAALSSEGQRAEQAQRDFINAVLRRESGAVISPGEFANAQKQYLPQPNDDAKTLEQKRRNRALAIQGMAAEVPGGLRSSPSLTNTGKPGSSSGREASGKVGEASILDQADAILRGGK